MDQILQMFIKVCVVNFVTNFVPIYTNNGWVNITNDEVKMLIHFIRVLTYHTKLNFANRNTESPAFISNNNTI